MNTPRILIAGLNGGTGKTFVSLGIARSLANSSLRVRPFKKGPDYIDTRWLGLASRSPASNLDPFLMPEALLRPFFLQQAMGYDVSIIEGNRGVFDGKDVHGSCSTAWLAKKVQAPVILVINCTKMTRTVAALVNGVQSFDPDMQFAGLILNRTANERHRALLRAAIEEYCSVPVLGILPRTAQNPIPERQTGLYSDAELAHSDAALDSVARLLRENADMERVLEIAHSAVPYYGDGTALIEQNGKSADTVSSCAMPSVNVWGVLNVQLGAQVFNEDAGASEKAVATGDSANFEDKSSEAGEEDTKTGDIARKPRIGYAFDAAFWFYYEENLEALRRAGAELIPVSLLDAQAASLLSTLDGLYIGSGFFDTFVADLSDNAGVRAKIAECAQNGMPIYAESGGFCYLCKEFVAGETVYPMAGVFPLRVKMGKKPQGLGYIRATALNDSCFYAKGAEFIAHEFHYFTVEAAGAVETVDAAEYGEKTGCMSAGAALPPHALAIQRGTAKEPVLDGMVQGHCFGTFSHIHAFSTPQWAGAFVRGAGEFAQQRF